MTKRSVPLFVTALLVAVPAQAAAAANGGTAYGSVPLPTRPPKAPTPTPTPTPNALLAGTVARPPKGAPRAVRLAIAAANQLQALPYRFGGGHATFKDTAYDCSGTVSYMLHGAGL